MGGLLGIDWPAVKVLLEAHGVALDATLVAALRIVERAAAAELRTAAGRT